MKEATGELSMTVVTIVAIVGVLAIVSYFLVPKAGEFIENQWNDMAGKTNETGKNTWNNR